MIPMLSMAWQRRQDPDRNTDSGDGDKSRYDGRFVANDAVLGTWEVIDEVPSIGEFVPGNEGKDRGRRRRGPKPPFQKITVEDEGRTSLGTWIWSGAILMDLDRYQALKMSVERIGGREYLFVEAGGFSARNGPDWRPPLWVLQRSGN